MPPITVSMDRLPDIFNSALELDEHAVLYSQKNRNNCMKSVKEIDIECYQRKLIEMDLSILELTPANVANALYNIAKECKVQPLRRTNRWSLDMTNGNT